MPEKVHNRIHFGVPIFECRFEDFAARQSALVDHLLQLRAQDDGVTRSNQGGWHSRDELHLDETPVIRELIGRIGTIAAECIRHHDRLDDGAAIRMTECWANISPKGAWHAPHNHVPRNWSGVFHVDVDESPVHKPGPIQDGELVFFDPMPLSFSLNRPPTISYPPKNGGLFLFPAYLLHMVAPHGGDAPRISLAFNFVIDVRA